MTATIQTKTLGEIKEYLKQRLHKTLKIGILQTNNIAR